MSILKPIRALQLNKTHPLARGLVGCWLFNEGGGNQVFDLSGNNNIGTLYNDTHFVAGKFGHALDFDGSGDYVSVPDNSILKPDYVTVALWTKMTDFPQYTGLVCHRSSSSTAAYRIRGNNNGEFQVDIGGTRYESPASTVNLEDDNWHFIVGTYDGSYIRLYVDGQQQGSGTSQSGTLSYGNYDLIIGAFNESSYFITGQIDHVMIFNRGLAASEISLLYREPFCMFDRGISPALLFVPTVQTINLAGTSIAQSTVSATAKLVKQISGSLAANTNVAAFLKIIGGVLLAGVIESAAATAGILTLSYCGPWLTSLLKMERQWLTDALLNGMTSNAFKFGTTLNLGWCWMRPSGCTVLYRGPSMEQIDFTNILAVIEQNAESMPLPSYIPHDSDSICFYIVRRFNNCGCQEWTLQAAVKVAIDAEGNLAEPLPNNIFTWRAEQVNDNKVQLIWFYSPLEQKSKPERFKVYYDGGTGQIDYENPIDTISYRGLKFYCWQSEALTTGRYLFAVRSEDAGGIQNNSSAKIAIEIVSKIPDVIKILKVETM